MKMDQLYRRFRGTVRFTAEGGHALRMPGLLAADGIPLYGVTPTDLGFEAEIAAEHYRKAAKAARRTGTRIRLREKHFSPHADDAHRRCCPCNRRLDSL